MTYREAVDYLNKFINYEKKGSFSYKESFKLDRMKRLSSLLGDPHKSCKAIHVAGTKGKGSTCALVHSILTKASFKAGLYTSPHLVSFTERIMIGPNHISENDVGLLMDEIKEAVDKMPDAAPSFFEVYTALAFLYFKKEGVDIVVYETGLGGRLDATNILEPLVCAITPISFEHTKILGTTLAEIAIEKAGIIKEGSICVSSPQEPDALSGIRNVCENKNAKLLLVGDDINFEEVEFSDEGEVFNVSGLFDAYNDIHMKMIGEHQVVNAATAIGVIEALRLSGINISSEDIRRGVESAIWPGRLELIKGSPRILLDGAQNHASARALARAVKRSFKYRRLILVLGVSKDKDIKGILKELIPISDVVVLTKSNVAERAEDPENIKERITGNKIAISITGTVRDGLNEALSKASPQDLVLVTGSLFVVGEAKELI